MYEKKKTKKNYYSTITFPSSKMFQLLIILQTLFYCNVFVTAGVSVTDSVIIKAIVLDMSVDAPARSMWQAIKQYNGYCGCGHCKETGEHLDLGPGKGNRRRMCHVYPFNKTFAATTGHAGKRKHEEVKQQALEALRQRRQGKKNVSFI